MQYSLIGVPTKNKRIRPLKASYRKELKIAEYLKEWNTIEGVELYKDLYKLCEQLFFATQNNKLDCLNYYIDEEQDCSKTYVIMYAEIKNTSELPMKKRYELHLQLLKDIHENSQALKHSTLKHIYGNTETGQFNLFN